MTVRGVGRGVAAQHSIKAIEETRAELVERLRARSHEIEATIVARVLEAAPSPLADEDPEYLIGLQTTVTAVLDYGLQVIQRGEMRSISIPTTAVAQAHRAARDGVSLDTVLLRYTHGLAVLGDFIMHEVEHGDLVGQRAALRNIWWMQCSLLEHLMASIAKEYKCEQERTTRSPQHSRVEQVRRLLAGTPIDTASLDYDFDAWHSCIIFVGENGTQAARSLASSLDRALLHVPREEETVWAWLGGQRRIAASDIEKVVSDIELSGITLAAGEPGWGVAGWRLTHRQARAALQVALLGKRRIATYAAAALLVPWLQDQTLARSFMEIHLSPLDGQRDEGAALRETLRAYFDAGHNLKAAAARLRVDRGTLRRRLATIEDRLGYVIHTREAELNVALRLEEILRHASDHDGHLPRLAP